MVAPAKIFTPLNLARMGIAAVLLFSLHQLGDMKLPWKSAWGRHRAEGTSPSYNEHVQTGLWGGAAARAGLAGLLLMASIGWGWEKPAPERSTLHPKFSGETPPSGRSFAAVLGVIVLGAIFMRLPRMTQSFWGDEADAVGSYIHGQYRPLKKRDPQGALYFEQPTWNQTLFSAKHGPNNHVLMSLLSRACLDGWQDWCGRKQTEFTEWPMRVPSLMAGLGSLVTLALLLRRWHAPWLGLIAAAFMALHPWHVRYSTEARGYAIALCLLPVFLHLLTDALERNRWRDWLFLSLTEFLLMWTWPGAAYPLAFINFTAAVLMLMRSDRWALMVRWLTANLLAAAVFISLYAPHLPQISDYNKTHLWMKGGPMDERWAHDVMAFPFTGIPFTEVFPDNAAEISWQRLFAHSPIITSVGFGLILISVFLGIALLWRRNRPTTALIVSTLVAAVVCAFHFKFFVGDEMRPWYLLFTLPGIAVCAAAGIMGIAQSLSRLPALHATPHLRTALPVVLLALTTCSVWPMNASLMTRASEDFKGAVAATRDRHETFNPKTGTKVSTIWLWRFAALYDPRGQIHVRDAASLGQSIQAARTNADELYVIVGYRELAERLNAGMLAMLDDPNLFERTRDFPAHQSLQSLTVYHLKKG